jgi:hypothetical protein
VSANGHLPTRLNAGAVTEGSVVAVGFEEPRRPGPEHDERELLLSYIRWQREQVVATTKGLTEEQLRWRPPDRLLPLLGIIDHLTHMERHWVEGTYLGADSGARGGGFEVPPEVPAEQVIEAYWEQGQRTDAIVRAAGSLSEACVGDHSGRGPVHLRFGFDEPVDLRWVLLHLIDETAHHAGHADSTRELLDGTKMRS